MHAAASNVCITNIGRRNEEYVSRHLFPGCTCTHLVFDPRCRFSSRRKCSISLYRSPSLLLSKYQNPFFENSSLSLSRLSSSNFRPALSRERGIASLSKFQPSFLFFSYSNARARKHKLFVLNTCVYMYMLLHIA